MVLKQKQVKAQRQHGKPFLEYPGSVEVPFRYSGRKVQKNLVFGPNLIRLVQNSSVTRFLSIPTGCPMGNIVLVTQHSNGTAWTKSSDATVAALVASSSRRHAAAVTQRIQQKRHRHGSRGNKRRLSPSTCCLSELAVELALTLGCRCLCLRRPGCLQDEWPAGTIVRCPHLSPSSHHRYQEQPHHCRPATRNLYCYTATVKE